MAKNIFIHPLKQCIYCLVTKPSKLFNKEHVIPQLMGRFEQGQTIKSVCQDCNSYFGRYVDPVFAEDAYEAILRTKQGLKTASALDHLWYERIAITVPGTGWWAGARIKLKEQSGDSVLSLPTQLGLYRKSSQRYEYFLLSELYRVDDWSDFETKKYKIMSQNREEENSLKEFCLEKFGSSITFEVQSEALPIENGELEVELTSRIDDLVKRAVCKIAFNYLARHIAKDKAKLLVSSIFDGIRNFARHGTQIRPEPIKISIGNENSILKLPENQGIYAHLIALDYSPSGSLHCRFSPYDHFHYEVILASNVERIVERTAHAFFYKTEPKVCEPLLTAPPS